MGVMRATSRSPMSDISPVFEVDDIFTLFKISAGYFKQFVNALHDVPMITLYIHKRGIWHVFNLLQCVIFLISLTCYPDYEKEQIEIKFYYQQVAS